MEIPYLSLKEIQSLNSEKLTQLKTQMGEITFDNVVKLNITRELVDAKTTHLSVAERISAVDNMTELNKQIFASDDAVSAKFPVQSDSDATVKRTPPAEFNHINVSLSMAIARWAIRDSAKIEGAWQWNQDATVRKVGQKFAALLDNHVLSNLKTGVPAGNKVTAANKWAQNAADIEGDIASAIAKVVEFSDLDPTLLGNETVFACVLPAKVWDTINRFKLIRNVNDTIKDVTQKQFSVEFMFTRKPRNDSEFATWPIETQALIVPMNNIEVGAIARLSREIHFPAQKVMETPTGQEVFERRWWKHYIRPQPFDGSTTTNALLAQVDGIA